MVDPKQLETGLDALTAAANAGNPAARQKALFEKANDGSINPEERDELLKSLGGGGALAGAVTAPLQTDALAKAVDVSPYIKEQHAGVVEALATLANRIEKSEGGEHTFRVALATSVVQLADMVKSLGDHVATLSGQPAGPVLSKGVTGGQGPPATPVERPIGGQPPAANKLSKGEVMEFMQKISENNGGFSKSGENMSTAIAKYEITTEISKALSQEVISLAKADRANPQTA